MADSSSWKCDRVWDGADFTPCFQKHYLSNVSFVLIPLSLLLILTHRYSTRSTRPTPLSPSSLTSPIGDLNLISLESDTILSALAANLLPPDLDGESETKLNGEIGAEVIDEFIKDETGEVRRWRRTKWMVGVVGALIWLGTTVWDCSIHGKWTKIAFPIYISLLSLLHRPPLAPVLLAHLVPTLLSLRSYVLRTSSPSVSAILPPMVELVYWTTLMSLPYAQPLEGLLSGGKSQGGGSLGSYGKQLPAHLEEPTSAFSRATYTFMLPFLVHHYRTAIKLTDIPAIREDDSAVAALASFRANQAWHDAKWAKKHLGEERKRDLGWNLFRFFLPEIAAQCLWSVMFICLQYLPPTGLRLLLKFVSERDTSDTPSHIAYLYIGMMVAGQCLGVIVFGQSLYLGRRLCIRIRAVIIAEVFTKALRRRDTAGSVKSGDKDAASTDGRIANLVSNDAFNISEICAYIQHLAGCPFAILLNGFLLYDTLGYAAFAGIAVLLIFLPIGGYVGRLYSEIQRTFMGATDVRLETVTEVISHIKLIKFNAWEGKFYDRMMITRNKELAVLARRFAIAVLFQVLVWGTPVIVTATAFAVHSLVLHQPLTADRAFASLILFNMLRDPLALLQDTSTRLLQAYTSCTRIQAYLNEPDTLKYQQLSRPGPGDPEVGFSNAVLGYETSDAKSESTFELGPLNLSFPASSLSIIVGPVGCGKTTLINSLLGETNLVSGQIFMPDDRANRDICPRDTKTGLTDTVAYCSQTPWLVGASIRENIIFGTTFEKRRYDAVISACALERDLEIFELGDETEVGEKGTTCSGGQKARIALARAVYSSAKTVILDDVLSAVDAQTARHLYNHVLQGSLMSGRTVIMVTHAVSLVAPAAAFVVMLEDGRVSASGPPAKLLADGALEMTEEMEAQNSSASTVIAEPSESNTDGTTDDKDAGLGEHDLIEDQLDGVEGDALDTQKAVSAVKANDPVLALTTSERSKKKLVESESQASGAVGLSTYTLYWKSMGKIPFWLILVVALLLAQVLQIATNAWIKDWANANPSDRRSKLLSSEGLRELGSKGHSTQFYLGIYVALSAAYLFAIAARVGINYFGSLRASRSLYDRLLKRILGAKMRFFDATPSGRITNRLSKDMYSIDTEAGEILMYCINSILSVLSVLAVILWSTPVFAFALVFIIGLYWIVGIIYVTTSREIKRFDSVTRSPIFISFSEVLVGMSTIRSYGDSARFMRKLFHELDQNSRCFWYLWQCNRVLNNFSNFVGSFVTVFAAVFALRSPGMDAGAIGLTLTYALSFTDYVLWIVRMYAAAEMTMNSVERVGEYLDLEVEEEKNKAGIEPPAYWPTRDGSVVVSNLTCKYAPQLDPVLRDVSFEIGPREKIGICGRTGSGKSTLALSFFRFLHQESGSIVIDGLNIKDLSLAALRSRLTILPQEAQLFSGTIRDNLDPFSEHEDAEIWDALQKCGLSGNNSRGPTRQGSRTGSKVDLPATAKAAKEVDLRMAVGRNLVKGTVEAADDTASEDGEVGERVAIKSLEEKVAVGGKNFSQGQRQLLALARGLLKLQHSSFLIMDESTANLDHATDQTIQNVLRTGLADTQMLVIAHRLMTVCGLDKILVLDHGKVVEFGTPWDLIQANGPFRELVKQSGEENTLIELARSVHEGRARAA